MVKLGYVVILVSWMLLPVGSWADEQIWNDPSTRELTVPAKVISEKYGTPPVATAFLVRNMIEIGIFTSGMLIGMRLSQREVELSSLLRRLAPRKDAPRLRDRHVDA